jgi:hypothetical protein
VARSLGLGGERRRGAVLIGTVDLGARLEAAMAHGLGRRSGELAVELLAQRDVRGGHFERRGAGREAEHRPGARRALASFQGRAAQLGRLQRDRPRALELRPRVRVAIA